MSEKKIQVTLGNYKGVEVKKAEIIITEEEVKAELERARQYAVTTQDKDGAAELGDEAVIDFVGYIDGEAFAGGDGTDFPLKLGSNTFIPGFEDQLVGAKKDDNVDVVVTFPEDYHAAEFAGKEATFKVKIHEIKAKEIPELDDEFVQDVSEFDTVAEYKDSVKAKLEEAGMEVLGNVLCDDDSQMVTDAISEWIAKGAEFVVCTGGMSVDPDDRTPLSIRNATDEVITYGAPVLPGAMFMLAYKGEIPVAGLPGCVMYARRTIFDLVLPRIAAGERLSVEDFTVLGEGGLCLNCEVCTYPNCGFGK